MDNDFCIRTILLPGDIMLTRGDGVYSKCIRVASRGWGEDKTFFNHAGIVVTEGTIKTARMVEALWTVKNHTIWNAYAGTDTKVAIYRCNDLSPLERDLLGIYASEYIGRWYGVPKIITQAIDKLFFFDKYVARRITNSDRFPICSWVVAQAYDKLGLSFGVEPGQADPDDIGDFIFDHPEKYSCVLGLQEIT